MTVKRMWDLDDMAGPADIAALLAVSRPTVANWAIRYLDYPKPLTWVSRGPVYSRRQVVQWYYAKWPKGPDSVNRKIHLPK